MNNFHALGGLTAQELQDSKTRAFKGNGTPFVRVPALVKIQQVRIGSQVIPLSEERVYPKDGTGKNFDTVVEKIIDVQEHPEDGCPVLLRSTLSNDGIWQDNCDIYISGEWSDEKTDAPKTDEEVKPLTPTVVTPPPNTNVAPGNGAPSALDKAVAQVAGNNNGNVGGSTNAR